MTAAAPDTSRLLASVQTLRDEVDRTQLPLDLPSTADAKANRAELLRQLDDYVIPRLESIDAPLLAVIGGSTGAGKSTLVNSILRREVSRAGVLRPTTTSPVLIHHPEDLRWFRNERILPELGRVSGRETEEGQPNTVRLVESSELPAGMALLDAPDIDSVVDENRALARQLLGAADLWLFDYHLDDGDTGVELFTRLAAAHGPRPTVILSADTGAETREAVRGAGLSLLSKPFRPLALRWAINHLQASPAAAAP